jgi:hypothetical protein
MPSDSTIIVATCERGTHVQVQSTVDPSRPRYCVPCDNAPGRQRGSRSLEMIPRTYVAVDALYTALRAALPSEVDEADAEGVIAYLTYELYLDGRSDEQEPTWSSDDQTTQEADHA